MGSLLLGCVIRPGLRNELTTPDVIGLIPNLDVAINGTDDRSFTKDCFRGKRAVRYATWGRTLSG